MRKRLNWMSERELLQALSNARLAGFLVGSGITTIIWWGLLYYHHYLNGGSL